MKLENTIIYLIGYPGVGKLATAKALCAETSATLVDNHLANDPILKIIGVDGIASNFEAVSDRVKAVRDILFDTILNVAPRQSSFVLTNVLLNDEENCALFEQVQQLAENRESIFAPLILRCEEEEQYRRLASPERESNMKITSVSALKRIMSEQALLPIAHPNLLELDNTRISAEDSAELIIKHIETL